MGEQGQRSRQRGQHGQRPWVRTLLMAGGWSPVNEGRGREGQEDSRANRAGLLGQGAVWRLILVPGGEPRLVLSRVWWVRLILIRSWSIVGREVFERRSLRLPHAGIISNLSVED